MNQSRLNRVIEGMKRENLPCILVSDKESIYYLTGRWIEPGERMVALVIADHGRVCLAVNRLFAQKAEADLPLVQGLHAVEEVRAAARPRVDRPRGHGVGDDGSELRVPARPAPRGATGTVVRDYLLS